MIHWNFAKKGDLKSENFVCNFEDGDTEVCTVKLWSASAEGLRFFAVGLSSLSRGKCGVCGITFDIFTHVSMGLFFFCVKFTIRTINKSIKVQNDDLKDGHNVALSLIHI